MNLKAKRYEQERKAAAEQQLSTRLAILKEKGLDEAALAKDAQIKKIKADIRKAHRRLKAVAAHEQLLADKKQAKNDKLSTKKASAKADGDKKPAAKKPKDAKKEKKAKAQKPVETE